MAAAVVKHSLTTGREKGRWAATRQGKGGEGVKIREKGKGGGGGLEKRKSPGALGIRGRVGKTYCGGNGSSLAASISSAWSG